MAVLRVDVYAQGSTIEACICPLRGLALTSERGYSMDTFVNGRAKQANFCSDAGLERGI